MEIAVPSDYSVFTGTASAIESGNCVGPIPPQVVIGTANEKRKLLGLEGLTDLKKSMSLKNSLDDSEDKVWNLKFRSRFVALSQSRQ